MNNDKRLVKSSRDRMICGVCAGVADYCGIDVSVVRLLWIIFTAFGGAGVLAYIVAAIVIPEE
ncbi:MAG: PspC domain-containing protein [Lachnospiraceae bacterium]|nr:PspC domain-containing protein [Candidatus Colinaster scatohippi]